MRNWKYGKRNGKGRQIFKVEILIKGNTKTFDFTALNL